SYVSATSTSHGASQRSIWRRRCNIERWTKIFGEPEVQCRSDLSGRHLAHRIARKLAVVLRYEHLTVMIQFPKSDGWFPLASYAGEELLIRACTSRDLASSEATGLYLRRFF